MLFEKIQLEENEAVLTVVRKHWFIILTDLLGTFFMILFPFFVMFFLATMPNLIPAAINLHSHLPLIAFGVSIWLLFSLLAGFMVWTHYYLDLWVVTDHRIIVIDQVHFFNRKVSSFRLERLQDIKVIVKGIIPTFLNFGTIHAHTAGTDEDNFTTSGLPDPRGLQSIIQKATDTRLKSLSNHITHQT